MRNWLEVPIIDGHVHLESHSVIEDLLALSREAGFIRTNIVCMAGSPERCLATNSVAMLAKARHPRETYVFGGLHYHADQSMTPDGLRRQAEALRAIGCDGIKLIESKPAHRKRTHFRMDDPVYGPFWGYLQETGMPILWHVADPATFWDPALVSPMARQQGWDYTDGTFPAREQFYDEVEGVLAKYPGLRVIFAHFYFLSKEADRAREFLARWPSVSFDITPGAEMYRNFSKDPAGWREFFTRHQDRIVFGTDNFAPREPWATTRVGMLDKVRMMRQFLETDETFEGFCTATSRNVTGLGLDSAVLEKIYSRNFERYAGTTPRPLDVEGAWRYTRQVTAFVDGNPQCSHLHEELTTLELSFKSL